MERPILPLHAHQEDVGRRLKEALVALEMDNVEAARIMGVSKQSVTDYIKGRAYPSQYGCYRLHKMTGITYDWLFLGDWSGLPSRLSEKLKPRIEELLAAHSAEANPVDGTDAAA